MDMSILATPLSYVAPNFSYGAEPVKRKEPCLTASANFIGLFQVGRCAALFDDLNRARRRQARNELADRVRRRVLILSPVIAAQGTVTVGTMSSAFARSGFHSSGCKR